MHSISPFIVVGTALLLPSGCKPHTVAADDTSELTIFDAAALPPCTELAQRLCAHFGNESDMCAFIERQSARFSDENCRTKLGQFERNVVDLSKYQEARKEVSEATQKSFHSDAPAVGLAGAPVVLTVFCDFDAADCARLSPLHNFVKNLYPDRVRLVYRQFPLSKHAGAHLVAEASLAAAGQGKFWDYSDVLFSNQQDHSRSALDRYAKGVGLQMKEYRRALDEHAYLADVVADKEFGKSLFVSEIPAVFANGRPVAVPYGAVELAQIVEEAVAQAAGSKGPIVSTVSR